MADNWVGSIQNTWLHSYWKMDGASGADETELFTGGGTYDLIDTGTIGTAAGKIGTSRGTYSNPNYFQVPTTPSVLTPYDKQVLIVEGWFKTAVTGASQMFIGKHTGVDNGWAFGIRTTNKLALVFNGTIIAGATSVCDNAWHYFLAGFRATSGTNETRIYLDGNTTPDLASSAYGGYVATGANLHVGVVYNTAEFMQGLLDELAYWDINTSTPSWAQIEAVMTARYNGGAGKSYGAKPAGGFFNLF